MCIDCFHVTSYLCTSDVHQHGISILGSVNLCETFRRISAVWENAQALNLEKCLLYLFSIGSQLLDFIHWMVFDLVFTAWQWKQSIEGYVVVALCTRSRPMHCSHAVCTEGYVALCTHLGPMLLEQHCSHAMCRECYVVVALCTHCRPMVVDCSRSPLPGACNFHTVSVKQHFYK